MNRRYEMQICLGSSCFSRGNKAVAQFIREYLRKNHLEDRVVFRGARCLGHCSNGPNLIINGKEIESAVPSQVEKILESELGKIKES